MSIITTKQIEEAKSAISRAVDRANAIGYTDGHDDGYAKGFREGATSNDEEVFNEGYNTGYIDGSEVADGQLEEEYQNGYEDGKAEGYDEGIIAESKRTDVYVQRSKKAILGRGGEISSDAGIADLPEAIFNIPADSSLAFYEDEEIAYKKAVPSGAEEYALLKSVGGMTYKCNNLIPFPYVAGGKTLDGTEGNDKLEYNGVTYTFNTDGRIQLSGIATRSGTLYIMRDIFLQANTSVCLVGGSVQTNGSVSVVLKKLKSDGSDNYDSVVSSNGTPKTAQITESGEIYALGIYIPVNVIADCTIYPMLNYGTEALPYEPYYEGLRDTKVTEIVSYGKNLFDASKIKNTQIEVSEDGRAIKLPLKSSGNGFTSTEVTLGELCPSLKVGDTAIFDFTANGESTLQSIYLSSILVTWNKRKSLVITQEHLNSMVVMYGNNVVQGNNTTEQVIITDFRMNLGTVSSPYTPYREPITYPIPEAVQALEGYGMGINDTCYNYIDYEKKQFVKLVDKLVLTGKETDWRYDTNTRFRLTNIASRATWYREDDTPCLCNKYTHSIDLYNDSSRTDGILIFTFKNSTTGTYSNISTVFIRDSGYTTVDEFKAYLKQQYENGTPVTIVYKLFEPEYEDISEYFDNLLSVEGGGTLEFVNEHKYAVPSTIKYTVKVGN